MVIYSSGTENTIYHYSTFSNTGFQKVVEKTYIPTTEGDELIRSQVFQYNKNGYLDYYENNSNTQKLRYNKDNLVIKSIEELHELHRTTITTNDFIYDDSDNLIEYTSMIDDGIKIKTHTYTVAFELDKEGRVTIQKIERGNNKYTWTFGYDKNSNIIQATSNFTNGVAKEHSPDIVTYEYDSKNKLTKTTGSIYRPIYLYPNLPYNEYSCLIKNVEATTEFKENGDIEKVCGAECAYMEFDVKNNWTSRKVIISGEPTRIVKREIIYY